MRVLLIASFPDSIVSFRGALIRSMHARGADVHVAAPGLGVGHPVRIELEGWGVAVHDIPLQRTGTNPLGDLALLFRLWRLMARVRPGIVMGYTIKPVIYGTLAAWLARVPQRVALVTGVGYLFTSDRKGLLVTLAKALCRVALSRATKVIFQNPDDLATYRQAGMLGHRIPVAVVNGSGIDTETYAVSPLAGPPTIFLMICRLLGDKGVREYAAAAGRVKAIHPEVRFQLVGWIDDNPDAIRQEELDAWVGAGTVEFLGRLADVRPAIAGSMVYVLPSYREGTPRTVLEAMAMGRAIITTDAPGCRETVVDGDNGFLVPVRAVEPLAEAMLKFIEQPGLAERMGRRSREIAEDKYDVRKVNAVMMREMGLVPANMEVEGDGA